MARDKIFHAKNIVANIPVFMYNICGINLIGYTVKSSYVEFIFTVLPSPHSSVCLGYAYLNYSISKNQFVGAQGYWQTV